jgi:hypothetical protein
LYKELPTVRHRDPPKIRPEQPQRAAADENSSLDLPPAPRRGRKISTFTQLQKKAKAKSRIITRLQQQIRSLKANNQKLLASIRLKTQMNLGCKCGSLRSLNPVMQRVIKDQLANAENSRPAWSAASLRFATGLWHYSPRCHRYLRAFGFKLPSRATIRRKIGSCMRRPGVCPVIEANVAASAVWNGMSLKHSVRYERYSDKIIGFEDCGVAAGGETSNIANEFVAVWLKGAISKWKQPIGHYLVRHSLGEQRFA